MDDNDLPLEELTRGEAYTCPLMVYDDDAQTQPSDLTAGGARLLFQARTHRGAATALLTAANDDDTGRVQVHPLDAENVPQQGLVIVSLGGDETAALEAGDALAELAMLPGDDPDGLTPLATWRWRIREAIVVVAPG